MSKGIKMVFLQRNLSKQIIMNTSRTTSIFMLCAILFCGCTTTMHVTSYSTFDKTVKEVASEVEKMGFTLTDVEKTSTKERPLSTRSYPVDNVPSIQSAGEVIQSSDQRYGFAEKHMSDYIYTNTYHFTNNEGETLSYAVSYRTGIDLTKGFVFLKEIYVSGCETSNPSHHDRLCGDSSPIHRLDNIEKDTTAVL